MLTFSLAGYRATADRELFVIGDIHGETPLLSATLAAVADTPRYPARRAVLILLGDLIDRGPDSLGCLDLAADATCLARVDETVLLAGNHELMLRHGLSTTDRDADGLPTTRRFHESLEAESLHNWIRNGGLEGLPPGAPLAALPKIIGPVRRTMLDAMTSHYVSGSVLCVHARLDPRERLDRLFDPEESRRAEPVGSHLA